MADFIETNNTKTATRVLENPIANIATFDSIISDVIANNPFECIDYVSGGQVIPGVTKSKQRYTAKFIYEDDDAETVGSISAKAPSITEFNGVITEILANTNLETVMGGDCVRDAAHDAFSCTLKCMDANGEIYYVAFTRTTVRLSSYADDAIRTNVEAWADTVAALA
ncbi:hypothetical protein F1737_01470 [Methanoplanus sp. FWC-SCC4]|uniref:Uncharacterized protein n=2 Tax=Methanochimaera problematica TaxID=2609417 RepID=A0AA97F9R0_9EURY|nr:hypothetical protein F1737_01470 [Methanoplanus sp. FWC-SCC4]